MIRYFSISSLLLIFQLTICNLQLALGQSEIPDAKQDKIDSLQQVIKTTESDTTHIKALNQLSEIYWTLSHYENSLDKARQAQKVARQSGYKIGKANAYHNMGIIHKAQGHYDQALHYFQKSFEIYKEIGDRKGMADSYGNMGEVHRHQGNYDKALDHYHKSLKIQEETGDDQAISTSYNNLGLIHWRQGHYDRALKYYHKSLEIQEKIEDRQGMAGSYGNMGIIHDLQGNYDRALEYYHKSLEIKKEIGDRPGMARSYSNIGITLDNQNKYDEALEYYKKSLKIEKEVGNQSGIASSYINIGDLYTTLHFADTLASGPRQLQKEALQRHPYALLDSARHYLQQGAHLSRKIGFQIGIVHARMGLGKIYSHLEEYTQARQQFRIAATMADSIGARPKLYEAYKGLADAWEQIGNIPKAYNYYKKYATIRDSVHSLKSQEKIAEMEEKYKAEKKQRRIEVLEKEKKARQARLQKNRIMLYSAGGGLLLILVFSGIIYNRFRVTQHQKDVIEEQNKEITASINYAKRIQDALLAEKEQETPNLPPSFVLFKPHSIVSGDFYWSVRKRHEWYVAAADCTGHGVPGALLTMLGTAFLNEVTAAKDNIEPGPLLDQLRERFVKELRKRKTDSDEFRMRDGMDISLVRINLKTLEASWSGANNPLYIIRRDSKEEVNVDYKRHMERNGYDLYELPPHYQHIGYVQAPESFPTYQVQLKKHDSLYMFSDGFPDQFGGPKGKKFKKKRFKRTLIDIQNKDMKGQEEALDNIIEDWMNQHDEEQIDDICVLGIQIS